MPMTKKEYKPVITRSRKGLGGMRRLFQFDNGYGASVVDEIDMNCWEITGEFELAVIFFTEPSGYDHFNLVYDTGLTIDVERYLTWDQIQELLAKIEALPLRKVEQDATSE